MAPGGIMPLLCSCCMACCICIIALMFAGSMARLSMSGFMRFSLQRHAPL